jgi:AmiR/NasT family two-component response regulator
VSPAEAFELLRRYARRRNLKLADVARTAIGGELPDLDQSR